MVKFNKEIAVFIFLTLVVIYVVMQLPIYQEPQVGGLVIEFKDGTPEQEVKSILENCNLTVNFTIDYNTTNFRDDNTLVGKVIICYVRFGDKSGNYIVGKNCISCVFG